MLVFFLSQRRRPCMEELLSKHSLPLCRVAWGAKTRVMLRQLQKGRTGCNSTCDPSLSIFLAFAGTVCSSSVLYLAALYKNLVLVFLEPVRPHFTFVVKLCNTGNLPQRSGRRGREADHKMNAIFGTDHLPRAIINDLQNLFALFNRNYITSKDINIKGSLQWGATLQTHLASNRSVKYITAWITNRTERKYACLAHLKNIPQ